MAEFKLKIITPECTFFDGMTEQIIARTASGNVGIMAGHTPYVANILSSAFQIKINGEFKTAAISGGVLSVTHKDVSVVTNAIEWADDIDIKRAERSKEDANRRLKENLSRKEFDRAEQKLKRALNRLSVAGKK